MSTIQVKRAFDFVNEKKPANAHVVLVDRVWPRGLRKDELGLDEWARHLAPSMELRKWFNHDPDKWEEFRKRYRQELTDEKPEVHRLMELASDTTLVLLFGARETEYNQAVALRDFLESPPDCLAAWQC